MNDPTAKTTAEWPGIEEAAGHLNFRIAAWHDFGYVTPPTPDSKTIPPLGERSAEAINPGHGAIEAIDEIVSDLYRLREQLIGELRADEDIRAVSGSGLTWDCEAYGPEAAEAGALCFVSGALHKRVCADAAECHQTMIRSRQRLFGRISELAAHGDSPYAADYAYLAEVFGTPDQLLGGPGDADPEVGQ